MLWNRPRLTAERETALAMLEFHQIAYGAGYGKNGRKRWDRLDLLVPTVVATAQLEHDDDGGRLPAEVQRRGPPQWRPQAWPEF